MLNAVGYYLYEKLLTTYRWKASRSAKPSIHVLERFAVEDDPLVLSYPGGLHRNGGKAPCILLLVIPSRDCTCVLIISSALFSDKFDAIL